MELVEAANLEAELRWAHQEVVEHPVAAVDLGVEERLLWAITAAAVEEVLSAQPPCQRTAN